MAVVGYVMCSAFTGWVCDCGRDFPYPNGKFPQDEVNEHWDSHECPALSKRMAGAGRYYKGLRFVVAAPALVQIREGANPSEEIGLAVDPRPWPDRIPGDIIAYWGDCNEPVQRLVPDLTDDLRSLLAELA